MTGPVSRLVSLVFLVSGFLSALAVALAVPSAFAAPVVVQLGSERVVMDTPPGYSDTAFIGSPRLNDFAASLVPEGNRILVFALSDADVRRFSIGDTLELRRILLAATPRSLERERVSPAQFKAMVREVFANAGATPPAGTNLLKYLDARPHGAAHLLEEIRDAEGVRSNLQGTRTPPRTWLDKPTYRLSSGTLIHLGGKAINLTLVTHYEGEADLEWIRSMTERWIDLLLKLNRP